MLNSGPETILITGCAGLLGSHLSRFLISKGFRVVGVDDLSGGYREWNPDSEFFEFLELDLNNYPELKGIYERTRPICTFHFAAYAAEGLSPFIRRFNYANNVVASASVINCCIEYESKMVFASSMAVYGDQKPPFSEDMLTLPADPYGVAKAAVEKDLHIAGIQHGLDWSVVRPHNVVGIRQNIWDRYRNVLGIFIRLALVGKPLTVYGDGLQVRAFSDVQYLMEPLSRLITDGKHNIYNLGSDKTSTILGLAKMVEAAAQELDIQISIEHFDSRHEVTDAYSLHRRAEQELGFEDRTDLASTVKQVMAWALTEPNREVATMPYEITKDLYSFWK